MVGVGRSEEVVRPLAAKFSYKVGKLPLLYQGLPIGAHSRSVVIWNPVVENSKKRLSAWKRRYLSFGGRIALINPLYQICHYTTCLLFYCQWQCEAGQTIE